MIAQLIAYEGKGVHFRSTVDTARRLLRQAVLHQAEWNYGSPEQIDNIVRKQWGRWWKRKIDGVSSLEYSAEFAHRQPISALKGVPLALARAAQYYLSWYDRRPYPVTYERILQAYDQEVSERAFQMLMRELFGRIHVASSNMTKKDFEIKAQLHAMNEGSAMEIHKQVYESLGITPTSPVVADPKRSWTYKRPSTAANSSTTTYGGGVTATSHPPASGPSSAPRYYAKPRLSPPPPMPEYGSAASSSWSLPVPPAPPKWVPRPAAAALAQGADAAAGAKPTIPLPPPPKVPGQRGPYPTAAEAATHAARNYWRQAG
jgi:hypothetical protein